jgi:HPr kinase/phosphorylase
MRWDVWFGFRLRSVRAQGKERLMKQAAVPQNVHATAVVICGRAVLILGSSGSGKSSLALALIGRGATLLSDDRVMLLRAGDGLLAQAPAAIAGALEIRGLGLVRVPFQAEAPVALAVDLDQAPAARMPQPQCITYLGVGIELISGAGIPNLDLALSLIVQNGRAFPE